MSAPRKYLSEFGLHVCSDFTVLLQQDKLSQLKNLPADPHIYIIGRRPRITIVPESVRFLPNAFEAVFRKQVRDQWVDIHVQASTEVGRTDLTLRSSYPFTEFAIVDEAGVVQADGKSALLLGLTGPEYWEHLDLEVLYVGQSFGSDGDRSAVERLQAHSTLQGIYAEALRNCPDQEVWLLLLTFKRLMIASFDGISKEYQTTAEEDDAHHARFFAQQPTLQQEVNFTEAGLIRYFQPAYNVKYRDTFPNPAHSTYEQCYDIDLNSLSVEVQTEDLMLRLWSHAVEPDWYHIATFPLHNEEERRFMFELL
jgi:hypothetical protein